MVSGNGKEPTDPNKRYPNPSFGLEIWGPLIPANDCRSCLYTLTGLQMAGGLFMWWIPGRGGMAKAAAAQAARMGTVVPPGTIWKNRFLRVSGILTGTYLIFLASLELIRLQLPHDPWQIDAALARKKAEQANPGQSISKWFGPKGYRAVEYHEWKRRVDATFEKGRTAHGKITVVNDAYNELKEQNREIGRRILETGLDDSALQAPSKHAIFTDSDRKKQQQELAMQPTGESEGEEIIEIIEWDNVMPWEALRDETDIQIRLIPHTRGVGDPLNAGSEESENLDGELSSVFVSLDDDYNFEKPTSN